MPPTRTQSSRKSIEQEGRILLAMKAIQNGDISTVRQAETIYNVPETTLRRRRAGQSSRIDIRANSHKLTQNEEDSLAT